MRMRMRMHNKHTTRAYPSTLFFPLCPFFFFLVFISYFFRNIFEFIFSSLLFFCLGPHNYTNIKFYHTVHTHRHTPHIYSYIFLSTLSPSIPYSQKQKSPRSHSLLLILTLIDLFLHTVVPSQPICQRIRFSY